MPKGPSRRTARKAIRKRRGSGTLAGKAPTPEELRAREVRNFASSLAYMDTGALEAMLKNREAIIGFARTSKVSPRLVEEAVNWLLKNSK